MPQTLDKTQLANVALSFLGEAAGIQNLDEDESTAAYHCNVHFNRVRDDLYSKHVWDFLVKRVALARSTTTPASGYDYAYILPSDCIKVIKHEDTDANLTSRMYEISNIDGSPHLLSNYDSCIIKYIARVTDTTEWSPEFANAFCYFLAAAVAFALTGSRGQANDMNQQAFYHLGEAMKADAEQSRHEHRPQAYQRSRLVRAHQRSYSDRDDLLIDPLN